jgi:hypothetical protein
MSAPQCIGPAADAAIAASARMRPRHSSQRRISVLLQRLTRCDGRTDSLAPVQRDYAVRRHRCSDVASEDPLAHVRLIAAQM